MDPTLLSRREILVTAGSVGASALVLRQASAQEAPLPNEPALAGGHEVHPLAFDPKKLRGLSERLLVSHHENNYGGAVRNLNRVEQELSRINKDTPGFVVAGLEERRLTFRNSVTLHERYFGNLGGDEQRGGPVDELVAEAWGSSARWEELFRAAALGLAGGSGWVVLGIDMHDSGRAVTYAARDHAQAQSSVVPLLVLDMYEHAYHLDFGAAAARYVDAFFRNVLWDEVNRRLERARAAWTALRSQ
jgi:Fe-Mn family superoxide dismutase